MDVKRLIPLACILGVLVWGGVKITRNFLRFLHADYTRYESASQSLPGGLTRSGFGQYLRSPKWMKNVLASSGISKECEPYVNGIEALDLTFFRDPSFHVTYQALMEPPTGCSLTDELVVAAEKRYLQACFLSNPTKNDLLSEECVNAFFGLRSAITRMLYQDKGLSEAGSMPKLTDLAYAEFLRGAYDLSEEVDFKRLQLIVNRMLEVDSEDRAAMRLNLFLGIRNAISLRSTKTLKQQDEMWENLKRDFERLRGNTGDAGSAEYETVIDTHGYDPNRTLQYSAHRLTEKPTDANAIFLSAYAHWRMEDHEIAFKELMKARELAPTNGGYREVYEKLTLPGAGDDAFNPGLKWEFTLQDFDK